MFTIKAYNEGHTYIDNCDSVEIITEQSPIFDQMKSDMDESFDSISEEDSSEFNPYFAFIRYSQGNMEAIRPLSGHDRAYILNDQGNTIEAVKSEQLVEDHT